MSSQLFFARSKISLFLLRSKISLFLLRSKIRLFLLRSKKKLGIRSKDKLILKLGSTCSKISLFLLHVLPSFFSHVVK